MARCPRLTRDGDVEDPLEKDTGAILWQNSVAHLLVIEDGGLDLQLGRLEAEPHEGELVAGLQVLGLHLHVGLVDSEGFAGLNVGDKECKFAIKVQ